MIAAGFPSQKLVGATALVSRATANCALSGSVPDFSASSTSRSIDSVNARYACPIRWYTGFSVQVGSVNRRSPLAGATEEEPRETRRSSRASRPASRTITRPCVTVPATADSTAAALGMATGWVQAAPSAPRCAVDEAAGSGWLGCRPGR